MHIVQKSLDEHSIIKLARYYKKYIDINLLICSNIIGTHRGSSAIALRGFFF